MGDRHLSVCRSPMRFIAYSYVLHTPTMCGVSKHIHEEEGHHE